MENKLALTPVRRCVAKIGMVGLLLFAMYSILTCPCERVGRCHWKRIVASIAGAVGIMAVENL